VEAVCLCEGGNAYGEAAENGLVVRILLWEVANVHEVIAEAAESDLEVESENDREVEGEPPRAVLAVHEATAESDP